MAGACDADDPRNCVGIDRGRQLAPPPAGGPTMPLRVSLSLKPHGRRRTLTARRAPGSGSTRSIGSYGSLALARAPRRAGVVSLSAPPGALALRPLAAPRATRTRAALTFISAPAHAPRVRRAADQPIRPTAAAVGAASFGSVVARASGVGVVCVAVVCVWVRWVRDDGPPAPLNYNCD